MFNKARLARKGGLGLAGEIGSANERTPGQWRVVVAWGTPRRESAANVKYAGGCPCGMSEGSGAPPSTTLATSRGGDVNRVAFESLPDNTGLRRHARAPADPARRHPR